MTTTPTIRAAGAPAGLWSEVAAEEVADAVVAAMGLGGVDYLFFTSGSEIMFYQEAAAKARALGRPGPRLMTMTHEHTNLNAAIGYSMYTGKPAATAVHVDVGTLHFGGAIHTASRGNVPLLLTAGAPPTAYTGTMRGACDGPQFIQQQTWDQNGIVRQYVKWDHRLEYQDNPGMVVSRGLQLALEEPRGPVYLSLPREVAMLPMQGRALSDGRATRRALSDGAEPGRDSALRGPAGPGQQPNGRSVSFRPQFRDGAGAGQAVRATGHGRG
jgi:acetolactate synthase-1/2/3 large subunit